MVEPPIPTDAPGVVVLLGMHAPTATTLYRISTSVAKGPGGRERRKHHKSWWCSAVLWVTHKKFLDESGQ